MIIIIIIIATTIITATIIIIIMVNKIVNGLLMLYHAKRDCNAFCILNYPLPVFSIDKLNVGISTADHAKRGTLAMGARSCHMPGQLGLRGPRQPCGLNCQSSSKLDWRSPGRTARRSICASCCQTSPRHIKLKLQVTGAPRNHLTDWIVQDDIQWSLEQEGRHFNPNGCRGPKTDYMGM